MFWQILNSLEFLRIRGKNSKVSSTHLKRHATCLWFTFECFYFCLICKNRGQTEVNFFAIFTVKIVIFVFIYCDGLFETYFREIWKISNFVPHTILP